MKELSYPFDSHYIMRYRKKLKKTLLNDSSSRIKKKIAVLGGSTTDDIIFALELFLLNTGIEPIFYKSEYNKCWEDAVFGNPELDAFVPDIVFIHTTYRNITEFSHNISDTENEIEEK
ncbi:MAG TPA: HAD family hydrolase, partial [Ruminococcus sp.]|nr:HAD family hydrolase [Ruminococcus sp.]